ncbi:MAG: proton-conducting transporter membrane subunit, partial [Candidatus Bathyarchaeia archaeon]
AFIIPFISKVSRRAQYGCSIGFMFVTLILSIILMSETINLGKISAIGLLYADAASTFVITVISLLGLAAVIYSTRYMAEDGNQDLYYFLSFLFVANMIGLSLTYNILLLYVFLEAATVSSAILVLYGRTVKALNATFVYLVLSIFGAILVLIGIFLCYSLFQSVDLRVISVGVTNLTNLNLVLSTAVLFFLGFGIKAGMVPFGLIWLPKAHAEAPSPISCLLSGVLVQVSAFAMAKIIYFPIFGAFEVLKWTVVTFGLLSMIIGSVFAFLERDIKRMLAYSTISEIGFIVLMIGVGTTLSVSAYLGHILNHALAKGLLFLCAGSIIYQTGLRDMNSLGGLAKRMPLTTIAFLIGAFTLIGIPPLLGFYTGRMLEEASIELASFLPIFGMITTVITFLFYAKAIYKIFIKRIPKQLKGTKEAPAVLQIPVLFLALLIVAFGLFPNIVMDVVRLIAG